MEIKKLSSSERLKLYHQLEHIALMLDESIDSGIILPSDMKKAQLLLDKIASIIADQPNLDKEPRNYILYEIQALIHWINDEHRDALSFIKTAKKVKGDSKLFSKTGKTLAKKR